MNKEKLTQILGDIKNTPNKDLVQAMDHLNDDFEKTKTLIIKLSNYLDFVEGNYTRILTEYTERIKK